MQSPERRELGRRLSRLANASIAEVLAMADSDAGCAARIGLTGPPGAGKSTLGARLALLRGRTRRVGFLAIDPSSPRSGGAILGDRIRIDELDSAGDLYVRSIASRSAGDGLAENLPELLHAMDAAGFDEVLLETVGIGQAEHGVRSQVDTLVLLLMPQSGDVVQAMKAGIMELADVYVVNKADLAGADAVASDTRGVLRGAGVAAPRTPGWTPPVLLASSADAASIERVSVEIDRHQQWLAGHADPGALHVERARYRLLSLLQRRMHEVVSALPVEIFQRPLAAQYAAALDATR